MASSRSIRGDRGGLASQTGVPARVRAGVVVRAPHRPAPGRAQAERKRRVRRSRHESSSPHTSRTRRPGRAAAGGPRSGPAAGSSAQIPHVTGADRRTAPRSAWGSAPAGPRPASRCTKSPKDRRARPGRLVKGDHRPSGALRHALAQARAWGGRPERWRRSQRPRPQSASAPVSASVSTLAPRRVPRPRRYRQRPPGDEQGGHQANLWGASRRLLDCARYAARPNCLQLTVGPLPTRGWSVDLQALSLGEAVPQWPKPTYGAASAIKPGFRSGAVVPSWTAKKPLLTGSARPAPARDQPVRQSAPLETATLLVHGPEPVDVACPLSLLSAWRRIV